uniref:hypothetical protein n=1 Tax=Prevotella sp. TaxID=59823 RepID=UPI0040291EE4
MKYLDPKADLTFKKIFGNHPDRLKNLLNTLQSLNEDELIQQQQYLPTTEELEISGFTDAELRAYDKFWDSVSVERTLLDDRYQKGKEEGRAEGTNFFHLCLANSDFLRNLAAQNIKHVGIWQK